jgi:hypothetical protein
MEEKEIFALESIVIFSGRTIKSRKIHGWQNPDPHNDPIQDLSKMSLSEKENNTNRPYSSYFTTVSIPYGSEDPRDWREELKRRIEISINNKEERKEESMNLYWVAVVQNPTHKDIENGKAPELIIPPTAVFANSKDSAIASITLPEKCNKNMIQVIVRDF